MSRTHLLTSGWTALLALGVAACGGIGDGNAPQTLELRIAGNSENPEIFQCVVSTPQAVLTFTDGSAGDFVRRVDWTSSDPEVLQVSDGTLQGPGGFFLRGTLLPRRPGTVTLSAEYLGFTDSIEVTVSPTTLEINPVRSRALVGRTSQLIDTLVLQGANQFQSLDLNQVGQFSIDGIDPADFSGETDVAPALIGRANGLFEANQAGTYTVRYAVDFCATEATATIEAIDEPVQALRVEDRNTGMELSALELPLDSSRDLNVLGILQSGAEVNLTGSVLYRFEDGSGELVSDVAFSTQRGIGTISSFARPPAEDGVTPPTYPRQVTLQVVFDPTPGAAADAPVDDVLAAPISLQVVESELLPESLVVQPQQQTILPGSGLVFTTAGDFAGPGGTFTGVDLSKDVTWTSSSTARATVNNTIGSKGFVFAPLQRLVSDAEGQSLITNLGTVEITARRFSGGDGTTDSTPSATQALFIGRPDPAEGEEPLAAATLGALEIELRDADAGLSQFDSALVQAVGRLRRGDEVLGEQDLSAQVIWDLLQSDRFAAISNTSGRKGQLTVLTDQTVDIIVRARYRNLTVQEGTLEARLSLRLNPLPESP